MMTPRASTLKSLGLFFVVICGPFFDVSAADAPPKVDPKTAVNFSREVLPILSDYCFHCHGPDEKARKGKLRLDTQEGAFRKDDPVILPAKSAESELIKRIASTDIEEMMP